MMNNSDGAVQILSSDYFLLVSLFCEGRGEETRKENPVVHFKFLKNGVKKLWLGQCIPFSPE